MQTLADIVTAVCGQIAARQRAIAKLKKKAAAQNTNTGSLLRLFRTRSGVLPSDFGTDAIRERAWISAVECARIIISPDVARRYIGLIESASKNKPKHK